MFFTKKFVYLILLAEQYLLNYNKNAAVIIKYSKDILTFFYFSDKKAKSLFKTNNKQIYDLQMVC